MPDLHLALWDVFHERPETLAVPWREGTAAILTYQIGIGDAIMAHALEPKWLSGWWVHLDHRDFYADIEPYVAPPNVRPHGYEPIDLGCQYWQPGLAGMYPMMVHENRSGDLFVAIKVPESFVLTIAQAIAQDYEEESDGPDSLSWVALKALVAVSHRRSRLKDETLVKR